jgi:hypothetical protein
MKHLINALTITLIGLAMASCSEKKPQEKSVNLEMAIVGEWVLSGFMCDKSGNCKKTIESGKTGITLTGDGRFFETQQNPLKYRIAGRDIIIGPKNKYLRGGLSFRIIRIHDDELLLLWNYNERDQIYTKYRKNK